MTRIVVWQVAPAVCSRGLYFSLRVFAGGGRENVSEGYETRRLLFLVDLRIEDPMEIDPGFISSDLAWVDSCIRESILDLW